MNRNDHPQMKASRKSRRMVSPIFLGRRRAARRHHRRRNSTFGFIDGWSGHVTKYAMSAYGDSLLSPRVPRRLGARMGPQRLELPSVRPLTAPPRPWSCVSPTAGTG